MHSDRKGLSGLPRITELFGVRVTGLIILLMSVVLLSN